MPSVHKIVKDTSKILQHLLQGFYCVFDHLWIIDVIGLLVNSDSCHRCVYLTKIKSNIKYTKSYGTKKRQKQTDYNGNVKQIIEQ